MKTTTLILALLLSLAGCDGEPMMAATDAGPGGGGGGDAGAPMPGSDAGAPMPGTDAGPGGGPSGCPASLPEVAIQFGGCASLSACGGDPTGTWVYDEVCVEDPTPDLSDVCAAARVEDLTGTARGCVSLDGATVTRDVSGELSWTVVVPASCTFGLGCDTIQSALGVTCTMDAGDCRCPMSDTFGTTEADTYTIAGSVLTTDDGDQYDFCVDGSDLRYQERGDTPDEPGVAQLAR